jgi:23S rRNA pseudouridine1911/1915/1917 synthase
VTSLFDILHEDDGLLVIDKPADLVCHPTKGDVYSSLVSRVRLYLGESAEQHLINRLDRETSGVVLVGKQLEVARAWRQAWETGAVQKIYSALVHGHPLTNDGVIDAPLGKDLASAVAIKDCVRPDGALSTTEYRVEERFEREGRSFARLTVQPRSGRKHQIRIHLAHLGFPIVGDKIYGPDEQLYLAFVEGRLTEDQRRQLILPNHALHARELRACCLGREWSFAAPEPEMFREFRGR